METLPLISGVLQIKGCELHYSFTLLTVFVKGYNRPILTHTIIGLWVISRVMVKVIEELNINACFTVADFVTLQRLNHLIVDFM